MRAHNEYTIPVPGRLAVQARALSLKAKLSLGVCLVVGLAGVAAAQPAPKIAARDQLTITVFGVDGLSGKFAVGSDGTINYPHLGSLRVAGLVPREVESDLMQKLKDGGFLVNPQVTVDLVQTQTKKVIITGAVRTPGQLPFAGQLTVFEALALAGSTTPEAGDLVLVVRAGAASAETEGGRPSGEGVLEISLSDLESGKLADHNVTLNDGDHIVVPRAQQVFISGQVRSPGAYTVSSGTTVLQALTLAGGLTDRGSNRGIRIIRDKKEIKDVKLDTIVKPGDTIVIKARQF
jgi:polysaccharide biosynthesis/export protein